jgi:predicted nucleic-acid-binding protein
MIAVDTNIVVRLLTEDDPRQSATAKTIFAGGAIWIAKTVLLETAWVLESGYAYTEHTIRQAFTGLLGLKNVHVESKPALIAALGMDGVQLADAIHLSSRPEGASFVTFDRAFVKHATRAGVRDISSA